jgi:hypothetical protein
LRISRRDVRLLSVVTVIEVAIGIGLRVLPPRSLSRVIARCRATARRAATAPEERISWAIDGVGRRLPWISTCLVRALAADLLLGGSGRSGRVRIGVRRGPTGSLESHAWFERDGRVLVGGAGASDYVDFMTLDTASAKRA